MFAEVQMQGANKEGAGSVDFHSNRTCRWLLGVTKFMSEISFVILGSIFASYF